MVEHNAKIILSSEVHELIRWFTMNHNQEIGATGTVNIKKRDGEKYFYVDKLFFPKQYNNTALVHFGPEHWRDIVMNCEVEELSKMNFYWHKHPGCAAHSGTDEDETFDTFMSPEAKRKYFIFLQTAKKANGDMDTEARIDLRLPIRTTILKDKIKVMYEFSDEEKKLLEIQDMKDRKIEHYCKKIIEEVKLETAPTPVADRGKIQTTVSGWRSPSVERKTIFRTIADTLKGIFNVEPENSYMDNDMLMGQSTDIKEKASIQFKNGVVKVIAGKLFQAIIDHSLLEKGELHSLVGHVKADKLNEGVTKIYHLQPNKGDYNNLCEGVGAVFIEFNKKLLIEYSKTETTEDVEVQLKINEKHFSATQNQTLINEIIGALCCDKNLATTWVNETRMQVLNIIENKLLGVMVTNKDLDNALFSGKSLIEKIQSTEIFQTIQPIDIKELEFKGDIKQEAP